MTSPDVQISIRRASVADAPAVAACVVAAYARWVPVIGAEPGPMRQDYEQVLATEQGYVAEAAGRVVGVLVLSLTAEGFLLENVAVHPGSAGAGLGPCLHAQVASVTPNPSIDRTRSGMTPGSRGAVVHAADRVRGATPSWPAGLDP